MADRTFKLTFLGDARKALKALNKTGAGLKKLGGAFKKLAKFAAIGGLAIAAGVAIIGPKVFAVGAELELMRKKTKTVFGELTPLVKNWAKANAAAMGLTATQAAGAAAGLADLLIPMKFTRAEGAQMAVELVGLSGALSEWSGGQRTAAEVTEILGKAVLGERDGLKALGKTGAGLRKLGSAFKKLAKFAAIGGLAIAAGIAIIGPKVFAVGAELELMRKKTKIVFGEMTPLVKKWAKANAAAMGLTATQAASAAASVADLLIPMKFTRAEGAQMATELVGLSGALSEWSGGQRTAEEVARILSKAMLGERESLKELGISITEADVKQRLLEKGQESLTGVMLQQAKAVATQELIFEKSTDAQAAFAEGSKGMFRAQQRLKAAMGEVKESIVTALMPSMVKFAEFLTAKGIPAMQRFAEWIGPKISAAIAFMQPKIAAFARFMDQFVLPVLVAIATFIGQEVIPRLADFGRHVAETLQPKLAALGRFISEEVVPVLRKMRDWFNEQVLPVLRVIARFINEKLIPAFKALVTFLAEKIGPVLKEIARFIVTNFGPALQSIATFIRDDVIPQVERVIGFFKRLASAIRSIPKPSFSLPSLPGIPGFAQGGVVPGPRGRGQLAVVHGGETIIPAGRGGGGATIIVQVTQPLGTPDAIADAVLDAIVLLQRTGRSSGALA